MSKNILLSSLVFSLIYFCLSSHLYAMLEEDYNSNNIIIINKQQNDNNSFFCNKNSNSLIKDQQFGSFVNCPKEIVGETHTVKMVYKDDNDILHKYNKSDGIRKFDSKNTCHDKEKKPLLLGGCSLF